MNICEESSYKTSLDAIEATWAAAPRLAVMGGLVAVGYCGHKYKYLISTQMSNLKHFIHGKPIAMDPVKETLKTVGEYALMVAAFVLMFVVPFILFIALPPPPISRAPPAGTDLSNAVDFIAAFLSFPFLVFGAMLHSPVYSQWWR